MSEMVATAKPVYKHRYIQKSNPRSSVIDHHELTEKLNRLTSSSSLGSSLPSLSSLRSSSSSGTMPSAKIGDGSTSSLPPPGKSAAAAAQTQTNSSSSFHKKTPEELVHDRARYAAARARLDELRELLAVKMKELREICIAEGEITGILPEEIYLALEAGEELPKLKRRVGTAYTIPNDLIKADKVSPTGFFLETNIFRVKHSTPNGAVLSARCCSLMGPRRIFP
ncbi:unnamed protein product [Caenorhabditis bovis]|uniref:Cytohesin Ubiquitin Protein Inducing domain-containing protein n=1 Tax=Caenorhabditis bovis TaxID=2654633 RepID=A0A8S1F6C9_9PELO|nr:unnamed protein product [Caenorhabditis bovis]